MRDPPARPGSVRAVFFDLDGTLMDHQGASDAALVRLLAHHGRAASRQEDLVGLWRALEDEYMGRYLAGQMSFSEQRRARVSSFFGHLGESLSPRESDEVFSVYLDFYERGWKPFPARRCRMERLDRIDRIYDQWYVLFALVE